MLMYEKIETYYKIIQYVIRAYKEKNISHSINKTMFIKIPYFNDRNIYRFSKKKKQPTNMQRVVNFYTIKYMMVKYWSTVHLAGYKLYEIILT